MKYSLLERLEILYKKFGGKSLEHVAFLNTNYRCHKEIVNISNLLFYESRIQMKPVRLLGSSQEKYPLTFICSSLSSDVDNELEAKLLLKEVEKFGSAEGVCLATASRTQVRPFYWQVK